MDFTIRPAAPDDADGIARVYNQSVDGSTATFDTVRHTGERRAEWLASHDERHPVLVAEAEGDLLGWGALSSWNPRGAYDDTVEISVYVDEACARRGVGRALDEALLEAAVARGHHAVIAQISAENGASLHLIESLGFERVGTLREVGRKFGRLLDVAIYEKLV